MKTANHIALAAAAAKLLGLLSRPGANHQKDGHQKAKANQP